MNSILCLLFISINLLFSQDKDTLYLLRLDQIPTYHGTLNTTDTLPRVENSQKIKWSGDKSIQLNVDQGVLLQQELNLKIQGPLDNQWFLNAELHESNLPLNQEGSQVLLTDIDYAFFEAYNATTKWRLGHSFFQSPSYYLWSTPLQFLGIQFLKTHPSLNLDLGLGNSRSNKKRQLIPLRNGVQSGYLITGQNLKSIIPLSEKIYLDGQLLRKDLDYKIEYATGLLSFQSHRPLHSNNQLYAEYEIIDEEANKEFQYAQLQIQLPSLQITSFYSNQQKKGRQQNGNALTPWQKALVEKGEYIDSLSLDSSQSLPPDSLASKWYWKKQGVWVSVLTETNPQIPRAYYQINFYKDEKAGKYFPQTHIDSRGNLSTYFVYDPLRQGGYSPGTPLLAPYNEKIIGLALQFKNDHGFAFNPQWQGQFQQDSFYLQPQLRNRLAYEAHTPHGHRHQFLTQFYYKDKGPFSGEPGFSLFAWQENWELPDSLFNQENWFSQTQSYRYAIPTTEIIQSFTYQSLHFPTLYREGHGLFFRWQRNSLPTPFSFGIEHYSLQQIDESFLFKDLALANMKTHWNNFSPYTDWTADVLWPSTQSPQDWQRRKWRGKAGLEYQNQFWYQEWSAQTEAWQYQENQIVQDSQVRETYQWQTRHTPHQKLKHSLSSSWVHSRYQNARTQTSETLWLIEALRDYESPQSLWKDSWNYQLSQGSQFLLRPKYEAVPEGTGDVLFDSLTQEYISGVDHGNFRLLGMERDTTLAQQAARETQLHSQIFFSPALFLTKGKGFLRDLEETLRYQWSSSDTASAFWKWPSPYSIEKKDRLESQFYFSTFTKWNPLQGDWHLSWLQSWQEIQSLSYIPQKNETQIRRLDLFYQPTSYFSINPYIEWKDQQKNQPIHWSQIIQGLQNTLPLPFDFFSRSRYSYKNIAGDLGTGSQNFNQQKVFLSLGKREHQGEVEISFQGIYTPQVTYDTPWEWSDGYQKGWGKQIKAGGNLQWDETFSFNGYWLATHFQSKADWIHKLSLNAKGQF